MKKLIIPLLFVIALTACTQSPKETAYSQVNSLGCSIGNGDAFRDFRNKSVNLDYVPKEELRMFAFGDYTATKEEEKEALKQLFKLSARGCYLDAIRQGSNSFK